MSFFDRLDAFHDLAVQSTGFDDFGGTDYVEPLKLLLADYDKHSHFCAAGDQMIGANIVGLLIGRLFTQQGFKTYPEFADAPVEKPIILVGMMRTGSTALHRLLAQDPANQALPPWLGATPMPRPPRETWEANPWYQGMQQALEQLYVLSPKIKVAHPMVAGEPDECRFAVDHSFWAPGIAISATLPDYAQWCLTGDATYAHDRHRRVLGLVAAGSRQRWVLKDPCHLWGLDSLLQSFPDACVVFTHRDIASAMGSMASLIYELRRLREPDLTCEQHGREEIEWWGRALDKMERVRQRHDPARFIDVHIDAIEADPMAVVERIYGHFDIPLTNGSRQALEQHIRHNARAGHGIHHYAIDAFGFTEEEACASTGAYRDRYQQLYPA